MTTVCESVCVHARVLNHASLYGVCVRFLIGGLICRHFHVLHHDRQAGQKRPDRQLLECDSRRCRSAAIRWPPWSAWPATGMPSVAVQGSWYAEVGPGDHVHVHDGPKCDRCPPVDVFAAVPRVRRDLPRHGSHARVQSRVRPQPRPANGRQGHQTRQPLPVRKRAHALLAGSAGARTQPAATCAYLRQHNGRVCVPKASARARVGVAARCRRRVLRRQFTRPTSAQHAEYLLTR